MNKPQPEVLPGRSAANSFFLGHLSATLRSRNQPKRTADRLGADHLLRSSGPLAVQTPRLTAAEIAFNSAISSTKAAGVID